MDSMQVRHRICDASFATERELEERGRTWMKPTVLERFPAWTS